MPFSSSGLSDLPRHACWVILTMIVSFWLWISLWEAGVCSQHFSKQEASQLSIGAKYCVLSDCAGTCTTVIVSGSGSRLYCHDRSAVSIGKM